MRFDVPSILQKVVIRAVTQVANDPKVPEVTSANVPAIAREIERTVANDPAVRQAIRPKPWWQSSGVLGAGAAIIASAAGLIGVAVEPEVVTEGVELATQGVAFVGAIVALYGRIVAKRTIGA